MIRLPLPVPRDVRVAIERGTEQVETARGLLPRVEVLLGKVEHIVGLGPRLVTLFEAAEQQFDRVEPLLDRVSGVTSAAAKEVAHVRDIGDRAEDTVDRTNLVLNRAEDLVERMTALLKHLEPSLTKLQPSLQAFAEASDPALAATLLEHLPELARRFEDDMLPVLGTLTSVAPDLRDLLATSSELNELIGNVPGFGRIKRRLEEEHEDQSQDPDPGKTNHQGPDTA